MTRALSPDKLDWTWSCPSDEKIPTSVDHSICDWSMLKFRDSKRQGIPAMKVEGKDMSLVGAVTRNSWLSELFLMQMPCYSCLSVGLVMFVGVDEDSYCS